jgi:hypothetical protein
MKTFRLIVISALIVCSIVEVSAQSKRVAIKNEFILVGKSRGEFIDVLKKANQFYESNFTGTLDADEKNRQWDYYYTFTDGKISGALENKVQYKYLFKMDTCRIILITPGTFDNVEADLSKIYKRVNKDSFVTNDNKCRLALDKNKKRVQASQIN